MEAQSSYLTPTLKLVEIILRETRNGNSVETFCVWAGEYNSEPELRKTIDTSEMNLKDRFEISEKEFQTFV